MAEDNKENKPSSKTDTDSILKSLKIVREELRFLRKISVTNYYGYYEKMLEEQLKNEYRHQTRVEKPIHKKSHTGSLIIASAILCGSIIIGAFLLLSRTSAVDGYLARYFGVAGPSNNNGAANNTGNQQAAANRKPTAPAIVDVSLDDDPVEGDKNAPITIVEFSDFDCPWCKTFYDTILPDLRKNYVDTGKAKIVYRDLPIAQLHPLSFDKSLAADCSREQGGDDMYFKFHDQLFSRAPKPGTVGAFLEKDQVKQIAVDLKLNTDQFNSCLDSQKYKDEVQNDINAAVSIEAFGTPTFFIGKSTSTGTISGQKVEGAIPFAQLKIILDTYVK